MPAKKESLGEGQLVDQIHVRLHPDLRRLVEKEANKQYPATMNDVIVRILAEYYERPELGTVPRKRMGRPPKVRQPA